MNVRSLRENDFPTIHTAFLDAFGDYAVPFQISAPDLEEMLRRRGYEPDASIGIFDADRLVAFTLNGLGEWNGGRTGYDTGTGVVRSHRGLGLTKKMLEASIDRLRAHGAVQYLLEVLQSNEKAFRLYRDAGFEVTRELQCWRFDARVASDGVSLLADVDWNRVATFFDAAPSWQNSIDSVRRAAAPRSVLGVHEEGRLVGCAVVFHNNGDLPFLAVDRAARRRGIGRRLLNAAAAGRALRILNVDPSLTGAEAFLESCGAEKTLAQYEMMRPI